ncbi:MAG: hypothetical protein HY791_14610 [Deltaproteobacteria bacterium]|nr:hypothetical protein [Deltaproteobacteria bacterium]
MRTSTQLLERRGGFLLTLAIATTSSCTKEGSEDAPSDAATRGPFVDESLGFQITPLPDWEARPSVDASTVLDLRRRPTPGYVYLVEPRVVVHQAPSPPGLDLDALARSQIDEISALGSKGGLVLKRSSTSHRVIDGVDTVELELAYKIRQPQGEREVVQRSMITKRTKGDRDVMLSISISYLSEAENAVGPEVFKMLSSVRLPPPTSP